MRTLSITPYRPNELSGAALVASRQVWLAGLGAAAVGREWIQTEAGNTFRTLVKEGTAVESRAIRYLGGQIETSMTRANALWRRTRSTVESTVKTAADSAVTFVRETLPRSLPRIELPVKTRAKLATPVKRARKSVAKAATTKRSAAKKATKRRAAR